MKTLLLSAAVAATGLMAAAAASAATFPPFGADTGPGVIITINANNSVSTLSTGQPPFDNIEDTYVGIINNSSRSVGSINLSSAQCIGCFDGDGIDAYGAPGNGSDGTGYGGPATFFTGNTGFFLTANFIGGLAPNGGFTYFSLEEPVSVNTLAVPEPATWALMLIGVAGIGYAVRRRTAVAAA